MKVYGLWGHRFIIMLRMLWGVCQCDSDSTKQLAFTVREKQGLEGMTKYALV
jgi:hypothetical protein